MAFAFAAIPEGISLYVVGNGPDGPSLARTIPPPNELTQFGVGLALAPDRTVWALYDTTESEGGAATGNSVIRRFNPSDGTLIETHDLDFLGGERLWLRGFHALPSGDLVMVNRTTRDLVRVDSTGALQETYGLNFVGNMDACLSADGATLYYVEPYLGDDVVEPLRVRLLGYRLDTNRPWGTYGADVVTNGTFSGSASGWTLGTGWAYSGNSVTHSAGTASNLSQAIGSLVLGTTYEITVSVHSTAGSVRVWIGRSDQQPNYVDVLASAGLNQTVRLAMTAQGNTIDGVFLRATSDSDAKVSFVSVAPSITGVARIEPPLQYAYNSCPVTVSPAKFAYATPTNDALLALPFTGATVTGAIALNGEDDGLVRVAPLDVTTDWTTALWVQSPSASHAAMGVWRWRNLDDSAYIQIVIDPTGDGGNPGYVASYDIGAGLTVIGSYPLSTEWCYLVVAYGSGFLEFNVGQTICGTMAEDLSALDPMTDEQIAGVGPNGGIRVSCVASWQEDLTAVAPGLYTEQMFTPTYVPRDTLVAYTPLRSATSLGDSVPPNTHGWTALGETVSTEGPPIANQTFYGGGDDRAVYNAEVIYGLASDISQNRLWMAYDRDEPHDEDLGTVAWDASSGRLVTDTAVCEIKDDFDIGGAVVGLAPPSSPVPVIPLPTKQWKLHRLDTKPRREQSA